MALMFDVERETGQVSQRALEDLVHPPLVRANQRVAVMGGSFDPPHIGHLHISLEAIRRLQLDQLWWLVSPGNPLKERGPWPLQRRLRQCLQLARHPRIRVSALEVSLGSPYTAETLVFLKRRFPDVRLVWMMGADNLASIHNWRNWQQVFETTPVLVVDRPHLRYKALSSPAAKRFAPFRLKDRDAGLLCEKTAPVWSFLTHRVSAESSTRIRENYREKQRAKR